MNNIIKFTGSTDWSRDKVIDHLERCQMAASVTMPAEDFERLLTQVLRYIDSQKPTSQPVSEPKEEGDFLSRLKAEHVEIEDRCIKLANFIQVNPEFKKLAPRMQRLLESQAAAMVEYDSILERRIYLIEDASAPAQESE